MYGEWGFSGVCHRRATGCVNNSAKLRNHSLDLNLSLLQLWEILFPTKWTKDVLIVETNKVLERYSGRPLTYGEWLRWIGIWMQMSTTVGFDQQAFWNVEIKQGECPTPYRYNELMSRD